MKKYKHKILNILNIIKRSILYFLSFFGLFMVTLIEYIGGIFSELLFVKLYKYSSNLYKRSPHVCFLIYFLLFMNLSFAFSYFKGNNNLYEYLRIKKNIKNQTELLESMEKEINIMHAYSLDNYDRDLIEMNIRSKLAKKGNKELIIFLE